MLFCPAYSQATSVSTSSVRQSDSVADTDAAAAMSDAVKAIDTASLPDVNTGLPTVCSSASISSSTETTDECKSFSCVVVILCHFTLNFQ